jgi:formate/nitrite transporter FocA (FNT family)
MADPSSAQNQPIQQTSDAETRAQKASSSTPMRCFIGALIAGTIATALYFLTHSIIQALGNTPLPTKSITAVNIAVAVRTLVVGVSTLATAVFAIAALGLIALGIQLIIQQPRQPSA